ncbi:MAG: histidine--tRNA ligase [Verrucomicrobiae bacterium]|nr:histidine--tRNA ligase [Verrucomicrobiae bacterium]
MAEKFQTLPGFRDFYPADCAARNYVFDRWRAVARRYGFIEYEAPVLEPTDLYKRKSGDEIVHQLFRFTDKGDRDVSMRPELTPSLARMAAARQRDFKKPLKWFSIGQFFRYEKQQKGRGREFYQFNCDILGESSPAADAELIALAIDLMRDFGFAEKDFAIRLSDRGAWTDFAARAGVPEEKTTEFLQAIDKLEREKPEKTAAKLAELGVSLDEVRALIASGDASVSPGLAAIRADLEARGLGGFVRVDLGIVRGLAYYTGPVFEVFDIGRGMRAVAGGGRYDALIDLIGGVDLPACGFAMGDMVVTDLIRETPAANERLEEGIASEQNLDVFVVVADESRRSEALGIVQRLRRDGYRTGYAYAGAKPAKQFQAAEQQGAQIAVVVGAEFPVVTVKNLPIRLETTCRIEDFDAELTRLLMPS